MRSRIGTESTITTTIGPTELKSHWISLKTELHVLCSLPNSTAGTKQSILVSQYNAVQPRIVLCCPPPHVDLIPGWQTRNAYLHWRKPRLVIHRNRVCILCGCLTLCASALCATALEKLRCGIERNRFLIVSSVELSRLPISTMILINHD